MAVIITVEQIKDGMIVAEPVINNFGFTLVPSGTILNEKHKKVLKTWNVYTVSIKTDDTEDESEISEELKKLAIDRISKRMKWTPRNSQEINLYNTAIIRAAMICLKQSKGAGLGND